MLISFLQGNFLLSEGVLKFVMVSESLFLPEILVLEIVFCSVFF
jgi:hypothetical protein